MEKQELRFFESTIEVRNTEEGTESRTIEGYALKFNTDSQILNDWSEHGFIERIAPGALDDANMEDVIAVFNHDVNQLLARSNSASKTLSLSIDETGLRYSFDAPNNPVGDNVLEWVNRGDISGSSFRFQIAEETWETKEGEPDIRTITKFKKIHDVGPVTHPAYPDSSVAKRSLEAYKASLDKPESNFSRSLETQIQVNKNIITMQKHNRHD